MQLCEFRGLLQVSLRLAGPQPHLIKLTRQHQTVVQRNTGFRNFMKNAAIIVAAGRGTRAGGDVPKQYVELGGKPVLRRTAEAFAQHSDITQVQVVVHRDDMAAFTAACGDLNLPEPVPGGETRQESVLCGLRALRAFRPDNVLIHDAARPFVSNTLIDRVLEGLSSHKAALPALPVADTLKRAADKIVSETVDRAGLYAAQTPQGFHYEAILAAHLDAQANGELHLTDDAAVGERFGLDVVLVDGDPENRKLTSADDIAQAQRKFDQMAVRELLDIRVGHGFDVHAFEPGNHVILCGIQIPHDAKLKGHSDADVGMHALTDAIYGALGEGDIGQHFPPSDPQWKGAASDIFLEHAGRRVTERGGVIGHADVTLVCEAPKIGPHSLAMRTELGRILGLDIGRISVKATTSEQLGFTGRREGIAAYATATIRLPFPTEES
jgi:2-C-methyl-D-erythritol 4-phosphate cytidylyltransferase/2-C-methyl-D-erythritol 2,4-cyclodiphosphate synthase